MIAYLIMYIVALYAIINYKNVKVGYIVWGILFFFSAFRGDTVGRDTQTYLDELYIASRSSLEIGTSATSTMEIFSNAVFRIVALTDSPRIIIFFFSIVTFVFLFLLHKRAKINLSFLMMVFLLGGGYLYTFNISRQWAAIAVAVYAVSFIFEPKWKKSLLFFPVIFLATGIHFLSISYIVIYLIRFVRVNFITAILIMVASLIIGIYSVDIVGISTNSVFDNYFSTYEQNLSIREERSMMGRIATLYSMILYIYVIYKMEKLNLKYLLPLFVFCFAVTRLTEEMDSVVHRAFMVYSFVAGIILAKYFSCEKSKENLQVVLSAYLLISTYNFFMSVAGKDYSLMFNFI